MHRSLQEMGRKIVRIQSIDNPGEREFLVDPNDIHDVLNACTVSFFFLKNLSFHDSIYKV